MPYSSSRANQCIAFAGKKIDRKRAGVCNLGYACVTYVTQDICQARRNDSIEGFVFLEPARTVISAERDFTPGQHDTALLFQVL